MSSNLKYFYIISFVLVVVTAIAVGVYARNYVETHVIKTAGEHINRSSVESFSQIVWHKHQKTLAYLPCNDKKKRCPNTDLLVTDYTRFFANLPLLDYEIYASRSGNKLLTPGRFIDSPHYDEQSKNAFLAAQEGTISSLLYFDYSIGGNTYNIVKTYFPVQVEESTAGMVEVKIPAILELTYNITPFWTNPVFVQSIAVGAVVCVFALLFSIMYYMSYKTEKLFTKQYEANMELLNAKMSAEEENREKSKFLANISHELRTPLNAIIGFSEIIKDEVMGSLDNPQYKEYITDIHLSGVHLLSLINDILDFSKADAGKLTVDLEEVDITKIMKNSIRLVTPRANEAGVIIIGEIPKEHYILYTDGKRLKQVLLNLFSNAVKFTEKGGSVTLYAWHNVTDDTFVIEVQDTGVGIAPKDISKVMATFGQVENKLSRRYEGTGLGLPLSKKLVELMGGKLEIESEVGKGTVVSIILPYVTPEKKDATNGQNGTSQEKTIDNAAKKNDTPPKEKQGAMPQISID